MDFKHCRGCGIPLQMVMLNRWRDDGILESRIKSVRGILVERELFTGIIESIHETLGISIDHIIEEAKRRDTRQYVDEVMSGRPGPGPAALPLPPLRLLLHGEDGRIPGLRQVAHRRLPSREDGGGAGRARLP